MDSGRLDRRLQFQSPTKIEDGAGNRVQGYTTQYECRASVRPLKGGEDVLAARLEKMSPAIVTVRSCSSAGRIAADWRVIDLNTRVSYSIKECPRHPVDRDGREDRGFLEFLVMSGAFV